MDHYKNVNELEWQTGNIPGFSSKKMLSLSQSNFKLVKVAPYATYPNHVHPDKDEVLFIMKGSLSITIGNKTYIGKSSDLFIFPIGIKHSIANQSSNECIVFITSMSNK